MINSEDFSKEVRERAVRLVLQQRKRSRVCFSIAHAGARNVNLTPLFGFLFCMKE